MGALLALVVTMFGLVPVADAAVCGLELPHDVASADVATAEVHADDDGAPGLDGDASCAHGHCHHAASALIPFTEAPPAAFSVAARPFPLLNDLLTSRVPGGLERPPRT
ncbi:hypothetical protein [Brevundimonas sp.]|uniref:hypothetical protein n=1 Tax=Brevundimonas sp. TaxID=1871086 RepID=UPI003D6D4F7D